ncbi:response regulator transcription factor [Bacillus infantis]|uniref:response regulator transcription factor n=1 Tax=Bacillus infantis TaxID=324767 RepID=UPI001CD56C62|nr:response regulator transcription factor [Bacillus infantis]MCA1038555.1 response regulator transcription factor [Bacillus infantis]
MKNILLVEDDHSIASLVKEYLADKGYHLAWSSNGREGWEDFQCGQYDLVIVDLMLPEMDGFDLCRNIRWKNRNVPLLILSAKFGEDDKVRGLKLGADDYLTKPFSLRELEARIEVQLRRSISETAAVSSQHFNFAGGLSIFPEKQLVTLDGREVQLTGKEFALLEVLSVNSHRAFTKSELYEHIWQEKDVDGNNTITVHIKSLRTKLGDSTKNPRFIQTIWGTGYRFIGGKYYEA